MSENNFVHQSKRARSLPLNLLEDEFNHSDHNLSELLKVNPCRFNEMSSVKEYGVELKQACESYCEISRKFSKCLMRCGSINQGAEITALRHQISSDCQDMLTAVNCRLEDLGGELLSNIDNRSIYSSISAPLNKYNLPKNQMSSNQKVNQYLESQASESSLHEVDIPLYSDTGSTERSSNHSIKYQSISNFTVIDELSSNMSKVLMSPTMKTVNENRHYNNNHGEINSEICESASSYLTSSKVKNNRPNDDIKSGVFNHQSNIPIKSTVGRDSIISNECSNRPATHNPNLQNPYLSQRPSAPEPSNNPFSQPSDNLQSVLAKQLLTKDLIKNSIDPFDGSSYKFWSWIQQIRNRTVSLSLSPSEFIQVLESNSIGEPKKVILEFMSSCGDIDTYKLNEMMEILEERFGSNSTIAKELLSKLKSFPVVKHPNVEKSLRDLLDLCRLLEFNMRDVPELQFLNISNGAELVREKLPNFIQDKWRSVGQAFEDRNRGMHPPFSEFICFLNKQAREMSNSNYKIVSSSLHDKTNVQEKRSYKTMITQESTPKTDKFCYIHSVDNHNTADCKVFMKLSYQEKKKKIFEFKLCYSCLGPHMKADCKTKVKCEKCPRNHCTALHSDYHNKETEKAEESNKKDTDHKSMCTAMCGDSNASKSCSKTLLVDVSFDDIPNQTLRCYAIIDEQSDCTLIDPKIIKFFNKKFPLQEYTLTTINGCKISTEGMFVTGLQVKGVTEKSIIKIPPAYTNDTIPDTKSEVATPELISNNKDLVRYANNFSHLDETAEVLLLIGRDCDQAMKTRCYGKQAPWIHHTALGWAAVGSTCVDKPNKNLKVLKTNINHEHFKIKPNFSSSTYDEVKSTRENVFKEFQDDNENSLSSDDKQFIQIMENNIRVADDGKMSVPLPFRDDHELPSNKEAVFNRTNNTLKRLNHSPDKLAKCIESMDKSLKAGHIEVVPDDEQNPKPGAAWWIPIFPVTHPKKQKVRLVYDASAKYTGTSLNDKILSGPDFNNQLRGVLIRFREGLIGFVADIQHMFNNFKVSDNHKDYLRFFWFKDNSPASKIIQYRSTSHIFGCTSSPAVANFCLRYTTRNHEDKQLAKKYIERSFYVDDGLSSANSIEDAVKTIKDAVTILSEYQVRLHKILSSSTEVLTSFPQSERAQGCHDIKFEEIPTQRTLGVLWNADRDMFIIEVNPPERNFTKRGILSVINSLYDPLGFVAPVSLAGRLIQRMVLPPKGKRVAELENCGWDDPLPAKYVPTWENWKASLQALTSIEIPRCYVPSSKFQDCTKELHVFADASDEAIGFAIYMKSINYEEETHVSFVSGGSKVAPQAATSMPRLELCAALEATISANNILKELSCEITSVIFYSDSRVVLGYLSNTKRRFSKYVTRRVNIILSMSSREQWCYVKSKENPADVSSRPQNPTELANSIWFKGPSFLWNNVVLSKAMPEDTEDLPEIQQELKVLKTSKVIPSDITAMCERINNWVKVQRIVTLMLDIRNKSDSLQQTKGIYLAPREPVTIHKKAHDILIKIAQSEEFGDAIGKLKQNNELLENHPLAKLSPFLDKDGMLRVGGRLKHSLVPADSKNPLLLPEKHIVTDLIVRHFHQTVSHQGRHLTHGSLRVNGFHIVNGRKVIRYMLDNCVICKKLRATTMIQYMADLPGDRLEEIPPFSNSGIDVFGPYLVHEGKTTRNNKSSKKVWVLMCVCLVSRAIHLEMLPAMDTSSFRNALARFISMRGTIKMLRSDNGSNFLSASNQMKETADINVEEVQNYLKNKDIQWSFNPPAASHFGGAWERKIGSLKKVLDGALILLGPRTLSRDELSTMLQEAASVVNHTPLWEVSSHPEDPAPLSPAALLTLKETPLSCESFTSEDLLSYGKRRWRRVQYLVDQFWIRWRKQYLQNLQTRNKWTTKKKNISVGDVVLIKNKTEKRNNWPIARVTEIVESKDGLVRSAHLKLPSSKVLYRSIHDLILLITNA